MKKTIPLLSWCFLALGIFIFAGQQFQANAQDFPGSSPAKAANNPEPKYGLYVCFSIDTFKNPDEKKQSCLQAALRQRRFR